MTMLQTSEKIGGPGKTVQIDESKVGIESKDSGFLEALKKIAENAF